MFIKFREEKFIIIIFKKLKVIEICNKMFANAVETIINI